jgi:hypothetical protein
MKKTREIRLKIEKCETVVFRRRRVSRISSANGETDHIRSVDPPQSDLDGGDGPTTSAATTEGKP